MNPPNHTEKGFSRKGRIPPHHPKGWKNPEIRKRGPFIVEFRQHLHDGSILSLSLRACRKGLLPRLLPERVPAAQPPPRPLLFILSSEQLNGWIGILFMIGSALFITGSVMSLIQHPQQKLNALVYFTGSIFFTTAAYLQYFQAINAEFPGDENPEKAPRKSFFAFQPRHLGFWVTFTQFIGTLLFNLNTFSPLWVQTAFQETLFVQAPNTGGSILFMISGTLAMMEVCNGRMGCWRPLEIEWTLTFLNFLGCVAFLFSAFSASCPPIREKWVCSDAFTLIGAICFFFGAYLTIPETLRHFCGKEPVWSEAT